MFRLTFEKDLINEAMAESLPDEGNTSGVFCVFQGCDQNLTNISQATKNINFKQMNDGNFRPNKHVPNYYF